MEFRLIYRGPLPPNGTPAQKHALREALHPQLAELWKHAPLNSFTAFLTHPAPAGGLSVVRSVAGFRFAQLVHSGLGLSAELDVTLLRPGPVGGLIGHGGDIDNRLKTLFDSLRSPHQASELPPGAAPAAGQEPFHCLLEDDRLITRVSVTADRLLDPAAGPNEVLLVLLVRVKGRTTLGGILGVLL